MTTPSTFASSRSNRLVLLAAAIAVVAALSPRDLWSPDEPRYGRIAWEMQRGASPLVSHWNGELDAEKPPLGYWLMTAGGLAVGEVTPRAARVPCALLAALAVAAAGWLATRWFRDRALGATAALLFATGALVLWNSSRAALDLPMTAFALLATAAGTLVLERRSMLAAVGCGVALGLGLLVKGPHALYVPVFALAGWAIGARRARALLDPRWLVALVAAAVVFGAWLVPALREGGDAYRERLLGQMASRMGGEREPHAHGFAFLIGLLFGAALPWTPAMLVGALGPWRRAPAEDRAGLFAAAFGVVGPLLLLSIATSKRELYLIPLLPCASMLGAYALHRLAALRLARPLPYLAVAATAATGLAAIAAPVLAPRLYPASRVEPVAGPALAAGVPAVALVVVGIGCLVAAALAWRRRADAVAATRVSALVLGGAWALAAVFVLPVLDGTKTWDAAVAPVRAEARGARVVAVGFNDASLAWALRPDEVRRLAPDPADAPAVLDALFAPGAERVLAAIKSPDLARAKAAIPSLESRARVLWERRVGPWVFSILAPREVAAGDLAPPPVEPGAQRVR